MTEYEEINKKVEELLDNMIEELISEIKIYIEKLEVAYCSKDIKAMYESASRLYELSYRVVRTVLYYTHPDWERDLNDGLR